MGFLIPAKRVIPTRQDYPLEYVRDTLNQQCGFPSEAVIGGALGSKGVYLLTYKFTDVWIRVQQNKITVTLRQMPRASNFIGGIVGSAIVGALSGKAKAASWDEYLGRADYKADDLVHVVADRVQQLFV